MKIEQNQQVGIFVSRGELVVRQVSDAGYTNETARECLDKMLQLSKSRKMPINRYAIVVADIDYKQSKTAVDRATRKRLQDIDNYDVFFSRKWCTTKSGRSFPALRIVLAARDADGSSTAQTTRLA